MASLLLAFPKQWLQAKSVRGKGKSRLRPNCATKPWEWIESFHAGLGSVVSLGFYSSVSKFVPTARPTVAAK